MYRHIGPTVNGHIPNRHVISTISAVHGTETTERPSLDVRGMDGLEWERHLT